MDLEEIKQFRKSGDSHEHFLARTFSRSEIRYCRSKGDPPMHFAGTFAAKEALYKAASELLHEKRPSMADIEIVHARSGAPQVRFKGSAAKLTGMLHASVSISHTSDYALAVAICARNHDQ